MKTMPRRFSILPLILLCGLLLDSSRGEDPTWWSFRPLSRPIAPRISEFRDADRAFNKIDRFVIAKLREQGLRLSPEADRRMLVRRLYFNIIGLPPTPDEVEKFVNDPDPNAYEKLVEKLLDSPRYGERWARHWLDVVHFGETHGYDKDKLRLNAWPYRDYVIRSFNEDKPYAQFVKEQIAGDILWPTSPDGVVATGFIAAGPWDFIGHAEVPETKRDGKIARHLDRDDMVATTMNTFSSITVQCAQCHDHKADPVTMTDYYSLQSVFAALDRADRDYDIDPKIAAKRLELKAQLSSSEQAIAKLNQEIEKAKTDEIRIAEKKIAKIEKSLSSENSNSSQFGYHSKIASTQDTEKWIQIDLGRVASIQTIGLFGAKEYGFDDFGFPYQFRIETALEESFEKATLVAQFEDVDHPRPGSEPVEIKAGGIEARYLRMTASKLWPRHMKGQTVSEDWIFALGELAVIADGKVAEVVGVHSLDSIQAPPRWSKKNVSDGLFGGSSKIHLEKWLPGDSKDQSAQLARLVDLRNKLLLRVAGPKAAARVEQVAIKSELEQKIAGLPMPQKIYAGTIHKGSGNFIGRGGLQGTPRPIFVLNRGDVSQPGDPVTPGAVPGIVDSLPERFKLPANHHEGDRRVALAEWITHPENKLTWRSIVNRIWQYHFGRGIVDTPNDFGRIGAAPSHPELLDWLAVEFRESGGSMKHLHRLILKSAVYRQSSSDIATMAEIDSSNQYLWRQNRRRVEAEVVRDSVLALAGKLGLKMGGPSFQDFVIEHPEHSPHYQYYLSDPDDPAIHRRSVYRFAVRSQPQPLMDALDCADPSLLVDKRSETNTALQALAMLNNALLLRMSEHFAERISAEPEPVAAAFTLALARSPNPSELETLNDYAAEHGLAATCRLILNLNEFSFID
jgi:hypothetical protein